MKMNDHPEVIADELIQSQVVPPSSFAEASNWVHYNCNHYSTLKRAEIIHCLMIRRKEYDVELDAQLNPYKNHPQFGVWG